MRKQCLTDRLPLTLRKLNAGKGLKHLYYLSVFYNMKVNEKERSHNKQVLCFINLFSRKPGFLSLLRKMAEINVDHHSEQYKTFVQNLLILCLQ